MKKFQKHVNLTQKRLKELLHYDPETGIFTRKATIAPNARKGDIAGSLDNGGYLVTRIDYKIYKIHRLAWLYVYGYFPENQIDHINRIRHDNRICNLREVGKQCNSRNCGNLKNNSSGVKGIYWDKKANKWHVQIVVNNKGKYLGIYKSFDEAVCHRLAGEQCLDWSGCDSNSPAYLYVQKMLKGKRKLSKIVVRNYVRVMEDGECGSEKIKG